MAYVVEGRIRSLRAAVRFVLASVALLALLTATSPTRADVLEPVDDGEIRVSGLNPDFEAYMADPPETSYGYLPPAVDLRHVEPSLPPRVEPMALASRFDWRDQGKVTPIKDQNPCGTCWVFGTLASLESAALIAEDTVYNFSEQSVALCVSRAWTYLYDHQDDPCGLVPGHAGGNSLLASEVLIRKGAVPHPNPLHPGTGAWIIKNSWGEGHGNDGYAYLAYNSGHTTEVAYLHYKDHNPDEKLLYWDEAGSVYNVGISGDTGWMANVFTASAGGALTHVEFWVTSNDAQYEIVVWEGRFGAQLAHQTGSCQEWGYYSIALDSPISMGSGQEFTIGVKMTTPGYDYPIPVEGGADGVDPPIQSNVSFIRAKGGGSWADLASEGYNACLRARMSGVASNAPPMISGLPDLTVPVNRSLDNAIDLWAYTNDAEDTKADLTFTINNAPAAGAGVSIDEQRYVDVNPSADWTGATDVEIQVQDTGGLTDTDTFRVTVKAIVYDSFVYLPLVMKAYASPDITPAPTATPTLSPTPTMSATPTSTATPSATPTSTASPSPTPTSTPTSSPTPTPTPTATPTTDWITIVSEDFEGPFPTGSWEVRDRRAADGRYFWGKRDCRSSEGSFSAWSVGAGDTVLSCGSDYPTRVTAWMVYGPFSLADATAAELIFDWWSETELGWDTFSWGASTNGEDYSFSYPSVSGDWSSWTTGEVFDLSAVPFLGSLLGEEDVWIAFVFTSSLEPTYEGTFVDNILLRKSTDSGAWARRVSSPPPQPRRPDQMRRTTTLQLVP